MLKIVFTISSVLLGCVLLSWLAYTFLFSSETSETKPEVSIEAMEKENGSGESKNVSVFSDVPLISPELSSDGKTIYGYHGDTGAVYAIDTETRQKEVLLDTKRTNPIVAMWARDPRTSILKTSPQDGAQYFLVDASRESVQALPSDIVYLIWDSISEKIAFIKKPQRGEIAFFTAQPDGSGQQQVALVRDSARISMSAMPASPAIAYWPEPKNTRISPLMSINLGSGSKKEVFAGKYGADYRFSPDGERILISWAPEKSGSRLTLAMMNKYGGQYADLGLPTLVSKCAWNASSDAVYCAVPTGIPQSAVMPDDYRNGEIFTTDVFWKINVETGEKERLVELADITETFDAQDVSVSPDEQRLYFSDRKTGKVFEIAL